jgi:hypothetical protein
VQVFFFPEYVLLLNICRWQWLYSLHPTLANAIYKLLLGWIKKIVSKGVEGV